MKKYIIIISILIILLLITFDLHYNRNNYKVTEQYMLMGFYDENLNPISSEDINISSNSNTFKFNFSLENRFESKKDYILKILVNDNFIEYNINDINNSEFLISINKDTKQIFEINIPYVYLDKQLNYCELILFEKYNIDDDIVRQIEPRIYSSQFTLNFDDKAINNHNVENNIIINDYLNKFNSKYNKEIFITSSKPSINSNNLINENLSLSYKSHQIYLNITNLYNNVDYMDYKVYFLNNYNLIEINNLPYLYIKLNKGEQVSIPINIKFNSSNINDELVFMLVSEPFNLINYNNKSEKISIFSQIIKIK